MGYFDKFKNGGIEFMDKRTKGDAKELVGKELHLMDYGFIKSKTDDDDFAVCIFEEDNAKFYFMNGIFTDTLHKMEKDFDYEHDKVIEQFRFVHVVPTMKQSRAGRDYMAYEYVEE